MNAEDKFIKHLRNIAEAKKRNITKSEISLLSKFSCKNSQLDI